MNLLQSLLCQSLSLPLAELEPAILTKVRHRHLSLSPEQIRHVLQCDPRATDYLWKISTALQLPHQWLFDAFQLQTELSRTTADREYKWLCREVCC